MRNGRPFLAIVKKTSKKILHYLNPIDHLGERNYSIAFALTFSLLVFLVAEIFAYYVLSDPNDITTYIIFVNIATVIYFSFRSGIRAGLLSTLLSLLYYAYLIISRGYTDQRLASGIEVASLLGILYAIIAIVIGWLKQTIDVLISKEQLGRRREEESKIRLQTILNQLPVGVLIIDKKDRSLTGNGHLEDILGRKIPTHLLTGGSPRVFRAQKPVKEADWPILQSLDKGKSIKIDELELVRRDKKRVWIRLNSVPIRDKRRKIIAAVSTLYDITQEKELEKKKDDFVNMASHELKTPITTLKLYSELLSREIKTIKNERAKKALKNIDGQSDRLIELVNDLLDVSRIQTGKLSFAKETFVLNDLIDEVVGSLGRISNKHTVVRKQGKKLTVRADRFRTYQVFTNLITNAIKYSPEGGRVVVSIDEKGGKALVSVRDSGVGIAKDQQKKIFERLYQASNNNSKKFPGLGMGLYISQEIIKKHRGRLWVESAEGKGSTFFFTLPLAS